MQQLQNLLELERAATHDLEMHTKQLKSQKAFLQNEVAALTKNLEQGMVFILESFDVCLKCFDVPCLV